MNRSSDAHRQDSIFPETPDAWFASEEQKRVTTRGLPALPESTLVGRDYELQAVLSTVKTRSTQILTILGPGGVGKTRLALTAAWKLAPLFPDGVIYLPFSTLDPDHIWQMVVNKLDIPDAPEFPSVEALCGVLNAREVLIVLDNCEKIIEALAPVPDVLAACPGLMVIATSQEALRIRGEQEFWLSPLDVPAAGSDNTSLDIVEASSAAELFRVRTRRRNSSFGITEENAADVAAIVRILDGLPLAIELAAAQMRHFSPAGLRQRLECALPSLSSHLHDLPERQRSLLDVMEWSLGLLPEQDRDRFLRLAVLAGDFTPETASMIMELCPVEGWEMLVSFADKSLIKRAVRSESMPTRFFMLNTVQTVALHLLTQHPESYVQACIRHAEACLDFARKAAEHWHGNDHIVWFQRMEVEHPNIEAAIERALAEPRLVPLALELTEPMFWFWYSRGLHNWALQCIEQLLTTAPEGISPEIVGSAHITAGWLAFKQTQAVRAEYHFREGTQLIQNESSPAALRGEIGLAYALSFEGKNTELALEQLRGVIKRAKTNLAAWHELAAGHFGLGLTEYFAGSIEPARAEFEASLQIARSRGDRQSIAMNLLYLAHIDRAEGKPRAAIRKLQETVPLFLETDGESGIMLSLDIVVSLLADLGEHGMARRIAAFNENMRQTLRAPRSPLEQGDFDKALAQIRRTLKHREPLLPPAPAHPRSAREVVAEFLEYRPASADQPDPASPVAAVLSPRELEVLRMVAAGKTASQIATTLFVSPHTVKRHMANIRVKLGVRTQAAAVAALQRTR